MAKYRQTRSHIIQNVETTAWFDPDSGNREAVKYTKFLAEGNTPDPAEPLPSPGPSKVYGDVPSTVMSVAALRVSHNDLLRKLRELGVLE